MVETVRDSPCSWIEQYKKCVQYVFKFIPVNSDPYSNNNTGTWKTTWGLLRHFLHRRKGPSIKPNMRKISKINFIEPFNYIFIT